MKGKIQQMVGRFRTANLKAQKKNTPLQSRSSTAPSAQPAQPAGDDWNMSPQDALQVSIVARYK